MHCELIKKLDVSRLKNEILSNWNDSFISIRRKKIISQREVDAIFLRHSPPIEKPNVHSAYTSIHSHNVKNTQYYSYFPVCMETLLEFAKEINSLLGRVLIAKLKAGTTIYKHIDVGAYYACRDRYHIVIQSNGSLMEVEDKEYIWNEGELWKFNNKLMHGAKNLTSIDRIHIVFDVLPFANIELMLDLAEHYNMIDYGLNPIKDIKIINGIY